MYAIGRFAILAPEEAEPEGMSPVHLEPFSHFASFPWWSEATVAVLEALTDDDVAGKNVVDFGCGASAILGLAAASLGARAMTFVEIQPELAAIARRQIARVAIEPELLDKIEGHFDFALANVGDRELVESIMEAATHGLGTEKDGSVIRW